MRSNFTQEIKRSIRILAVLAVLLPASLLAQNQLSCINVVAGYRPGVCNIRIDSSTVLTPPFPAAARYRFILDVPGPDLIGLDSLIVPYSYAGQTFTLTVQNINNLPVNSCSSQVELKDGTAPLVIGSYDSPVFISCPADLSELSFTEVNPGTSISECGSYTQEFVINSANLNCNASWSAQYAGFWVLTDAWGNETIIPQTINISRPDLDLFSAPANISIQCSQTPVPALTGSPSYDGTLLPFTAPGIDYCTVNISYSDQVTPSSSPGCQQRVIQRTWTFMEMCGADMQSATEVQIITVIDTTAPTFAPPAALTFSTDLNACSASFTLPAIAATDNCSLPLQYAFNLPGFPLQTSATPTYTGVPTGTHILSFVISDACGNARPGTRIIQVEDRQLPVNVCKTNMTVSLNSNGTAAVAATTFNLSSSDNCGPIYFKVKRMSAGTCDPAPAFRDSVNFCCADLSATVQVILRVYDVPVPAGQVADLAYAGHYNDCMVNVQIRDQNPPVIACLPANLSIDCADPIGLHNALQLKPSVTSYSCTAPIISEIRDTIANMCGIDAVNRRFYINGNTLVCTQNIDLVNPTPFDPGLNWAPADTVIVNCGSSIDTSVTGNYAIPYDACASISLNFSDELIQIVPNACFKVFRTWTLMDMCQQDAGIFRMWTDVQEITVIDNNAPLITQIPNQLDSLQFVDCDGVLPIILPRAQAVDCTPEALLKYRYSIDYNNDGVNDLLNVPGYNASGNFPKGTHRITFRVEDQCGNLSLPMSFLLTLVDTKAPSISVISGLAINLVNMNGIPMNMVNASDFDHNGISDNCTAIEDLIYSFSPNVNDTTRILGCEDLGILPVTIYITDADGNQSQVNTYIDVQDNSGICTGTTSSTMLLGRVTSPGGEAIEDVTLSINQSQMSAKTDANGDYSIANIQPLSSYELKPSRNSDPVNGVSTLDLLLIQKHILNKSALPDPYCFIAADANMNGTISAADLVELRKLILNKISNLEHGISWRFIAKNTQFNDPEKPEWENLPGSVFYQTLSGINQADFYGIKLGDIDQSASKTASAPDLESRSDIARTLHYTDAKMAEGEIREMPVYLDQMTSLNGLQFSLKWDASALELVDLKFPALPGCSEDNYFIGQGKLYLSWNIISELNIPATQPLVILKWKALDQVQLGNACAIDPARLAPEFYNNDQANGLDWRADSGNTGKTIPVLFQNEPNPFSDRTLIRFDLPDGGRVRLSVRDMNGQLVKSHSAFYDAGPQKWLLQGLESLPAGMYFYSLETAGFADTKKMILAGGR